MLGAYAAMEATSQAEYGLAAQRPGLLNLLLGRGSGRERRVVEGAVGDDVADGVVEAVGVAREQHAPADGLAVHHGERLELVSSSAASSGLGFARR
jgi:hypothetical protein